MGVRFKHLLRLALAGPFVTTAIGGAVFATADPDEIVADLKTEIAGSLGRAPEIEGQATFEYWPIPGLRTGPVWISSATGGAAVVTAESMLITPSPLGLVTGQVRPWRLAFSGARIDAGAIAAISGTQTGDAIRVAAKGVRISAPDAIVRQGGTDYRGDVSIALTRASVSEALDVSASLKNDTLSASFDGRIGPPGHVTEIDGTATFSAVQAKPIAGLLPSGWVGALSPLGQTDLSADISRRTAGDLIRLRLQTLLGGRDVTGSATLRGAPGWRDGGALNVSGSLRSGGLATIYVDGDAMADLKFDGTASLSIQNLGAFGETFGVLPLITRLRASDGYVEGAVTASSSQISLSNGKLRIGPEEMKASASISGVQGGSPPMLDLRLFNLQPAMITPAVPLSGTFDAHLSLALTHTDALGWDAEMQSGALSMSMGTWRDGNLEDLLRTGTVAPGMTEIRELSVDLVQSDTLEIELATLQTQAMRLSGSGQLETETGTVYLFLMPRDVEGAANRLDIRGSREAIRIEAVPLSEPIQAPAKAEREEIHLPAPTPPDGAKESSETDTNIEPASLSLEQSETTPALNAELTDPPPNTDDVLSDGDVTPAAQSDNAIDPAVAALSDQDTPVAVTSATDAPDTPNEVTGPSRESTETAASDPAPVPDLSVPIPPPRPEN